jgi:hypothetical protein
MFVIQQIKFNKPPPNQKENQQAFDRKVLRWLNRVICCGGCLNLDVNGMRDVYAFASSAQNGVGFYVSMDSFNGV